MPTIITDHNIDPTIDTIRLTAHADEPVGSLLTDWDCSEYFVQWGYPGRQSVEGGILLKFQRGTIPSAGPNGVTGEALIAVVLDRLRRFQQGPASSRENALAITKLEEALMWLHKRTRDRLTRKVEGTEKP